MTAKYLTFEPGCTFDNNLCDSAEAGVTRKWPRSARRKGGFTWTGSALVGLAAGLTIGAAYSSSDTSKLVFGVSAGSMAALGSVFVAVGGILQQHFTDRGCTSSR